MEAVLVGRDAERTALAEWLAGRAASVPSGPPVLLVTGEAGVGKTALIESVLGATGSAVVRRAGSPWAPAPFGLLGPLLDDEGRSDRRRLPDGPTVVVLDDLHWADEASLEALPPLAEAVRADPVAIIGAYRSDELPRGHMLRRVRAALRHTRGLRETALEPLDEAGVAALIRELVGAPPDAAFTTAVSRRTGGLPFFVEELLAALSAADRLAHDGGRVSLSAAPEMPLPEGIRDAIALRLARLPAAAREALDAAAVLGIDFDVDEVAALTAAAWPDDADQSGLLGTTGDGLRRFRHALAQEAIYADIPWSRRRTLHLAAADRAAAAGAAPLALARHLVAAHDVGRAREALVAAAEEHIRGYAFRDAARILRSALDTWPAGTDEPLRLVAVDLMVRCAELTGDHAAAVAGLRELAEAAPLPAVHRRLAVQYEQQGLWPLALAARETCAAASTAAGDRGSAAIERLAIAAHLRSASSFHAALEVLATAREDAAVGGRPDVAACVDGLRGNVLARMGRPEGVPAVREALRAALDGGHTAAAAEVYQRLADSLEHAGDYRAATRAYDTAYEFCAAHGQDTTGQLCRACAMAVLFASGHWDRAVATGREVLAHEAPIPHARAVATGISGLIAALRGRPGVARPALLDARATARRIELVPMELASMWGLAMLDEAAGRVDRAAELYRHVTARARETEERHYCVPILQFAVTFFTLHGPSGATRPADAAAATAVIAAAAESTGQPEAHAALACALGEAALAERDAERAVAALRRAIDLLESLDLPLYDAFTRFRLAAALLAPGPAGVVEGAAGGEAVELLARAYRTAHRLGAAPFASLVRRTQTATEVARAAAVGAAAARVGLARAETEAPRATVDATPTPGVLTRREAEVLGLVGEGLTSREIAARLFLSARTVEMHVQNAMTKLGSRTRAEAVRRLATG